MAAKKRAVPEPDFTLTGFIRLPEGRGTFGPGDEKALHKCLTDHPKGTKGRLKGKPLLDVRKMNDLGLLVEVEPDDDDIDPAEDDQE